MVSDRHPSGAANAGRIAVSFQQLSEKDNTKTKVNDSASVGTVSCEAEDVVICSLALEPATSGVAIVTASVSSAIAQPVLLKVPDRPVKPSPPVNLSDYQTHLGELIVTWEQPSDFVSGPLRYEVRYSYNTTSSPWQVRAAFGEPKLSLDLKPNLNYTIQVRCSGLSEPPLWSQWSEPHYILLNTVSYIPEIALARPGENVTVYCVFNDHSRNASTAKWKLNLRHSLNGRQYYPVNQWVSKITLRAPEAGMYDLLTCAPKLIHPYPYSKIFVEGGFIDIKCTTNGDIDAMVCKWKNNEMTSLKFQSKWAIMSCNEMEERERAGEDVGVMGPPCLEVRSSQKTCTITPLERNCNKVWLEIPSPWGPIRSKPLFVSPMDHVKPHPPTNVRAVSSSSGVLNVSWTNPLLPVEGFQCEFQYRLSTEREDWKIQSSCRDLWGEVVIPDKCREYTVQVRCMHISGKGYWSDWSTPVKSTHQNGRAPERGPDFWRIRHDDPDRRQSSVILLFEDFPVSGDSYCVDGFNILHKSWNGSVMERKTNIVSSYSFEWDQDFQTVTVEAFNDLGSSTNNMNMTLEKQATRPCLRLFHVLVINSTCVSLSWSLLDRHSVPLYLVVQWSSKKQQDPVWVRLPYTDASVYLQGDFFDYKDYYFHLYPVFADGEGEPVFTSATRHETEAYMMPLFIFLLCFLLVFMLVMTQKQMKKFVFNDVPNPKKCSWAEEFNFKKEDTFDHLYRGLQALPLLMPSEKISKMIIVDKKMSLAPDPGIAFASSLHDETPSGAINQDSLTTLSFEIDETQPVDLKVDSHQSSTDRSTQSLITYSKVQLPHAKDDQLPVHLSHKAGSGGSSNDEFSGENLDISVSLVNGVKELDSGHNVEVDKKLLYYPVMEYPAQDEEGEDEKRSEENAEIEFKNAVLDNEGCSVELHPLLGPGGLNQLPGELLSASPSSFPPLYLPQYRTVQSTGQLTA
ncbi:leptin receptor isoform 2-T3 [Menidia menidia]